MRANLKIVQIAFASYSHYPSHDSNTETIDYQKYALLSNGEVWVEDDKGRWGTSESFDKLNELLQSLNKLEDV